MRIEAEKIKGLSRQLDNPTIYPWEAAGVIKRLDEIANQRKFDGLIVVGDDGADADEAISLLRSRGDFTVTEWYGWSLDWQDPQPDPTMGMNMLSLPYEDIDKLTVSLKNGKFPSDVIDTVVSQQKQIQGLHPDKYPFPDTTHDIISDGLLQARINTKKVWGQIEKNLIRRDRADLALMYGYDSPTNSLTGFLVAFALTKQDIGKLNAAKREVHF